MNQIHLTKSQAQICVKALDGYYYQATEQVGGGHTARKVRGMFMRALGTWKSKQPYESINEFSLVERQARTVISALGDYLHERTAQNAIKKFLKAVTKEGIQVKVSQ